MPDHPHPEPVDIIPTLLDLMRSRLDLLNRIFHNVATDLNRIDSTLSEMIVDYAQTKNTHQTHASK